MLLSPLALSSTRGSLSCDAKPAPICNPTTMPTGWRTLQHRPACGRAEPWPFTSATQAAEPGRAVCLPCGPSLCCAVLPALGDAEVHHVQQVHFGAGREPAL